MQWVFICLKMIREFRMIETPFDKIKKKVLEELPDEMVDKLPRSWEKVGDILVIKIPKDLSGYKDAIGEVYADVLGCRTVLNDIGGVVGEFREPYVEVIFGSSDTETVHKENGVRFKFDPQRVMFSSGNMDERIRMANVSNKNEVVVDLFAGIGYFSIPMAVYSKPKKIYACEKNPVAYDYLCENIVLNDVVDIVEPVFGDNREAAPENIADRIIMGYIGGTEVFLPIAIKSLKERKGIIHFHEKYSDGLIPNKPLSSMEKIADEFDRKIKLVQYRKVKSYAPGVSHFVFDVFVDEK